MINGFQALNTITSGLILQQLREEVTANNISQTSVDSQGYLMNSLERVNSVNNQSISFTGQNGLLSVGTGSSAASITRLRSSYLDAQIQQESMLVGYNEILSNATLASGSSPATPGNGIMNQINSIVNGTTTVSSTLTAFAAAWNALAATPTSAALRNDVVQAGTTFANTISSQFDQLQNLQITTNGQIDQTVSQINGLFTQLAAINGQLAQTAGSNQGSLLDARDYALDRLSRLMNYQVNYASDGSAHIWLGGLQMVTGSTASSLETIALNPNNPQYVNLVANLPGGVFSTGNTPTQVNITSSVTGGNLGGELYGQNVVLQSYKNQLQQFGSSIINITNGVYSAGYIANSNTTGTNFFSGEGASNIAVNGVLTNSPTSLATEIQQTSTPASIPAGTPLPSGALATILGKLPTLLGNNYVTSQTPFGTPPDNPNLALNNAGQLLTTSGDSFFINGVKITYAATDTINDILNTINSTVPGVYAVFNQTLGTFSFYSANPITMSDSGAANDFFNWSLVTNVLNSSNTMVNVSAPSPFLNIDYTSSLNSTTSTISGLPLTVFGPNNEAFMVTPSTSGSFTVYYTNNAGVQSSAVINWNNTQTLLTILNNIYNATGTAPNQTVNWQQLTDQNGFQLFSTAGFQNPFRIVDDSGNFTEFTGLSQNQPLSNIADNMVSSASSQNTALTTTYSTSSDSLTQLNNEQANLAGVSTVSGQPGVPVATLQQQAYTDMIQFNAMLEVMQIIDQMLGSLVGMSSSTSSSGIFAAQTQGG